jgi:hypothetical protein
MSLPIQSLRIHAFRGLSEVTVEGLGRVNLLVGDNNSGKTSVLEAIAIYCEPLDVFAWLRTARQRVKGFVTVTRVEALKWLFPQGKRAAGHEGLFAGHIEISGQEKLGSRKLQAHIEEFEEMRARVQRPLNLEDLAVPGPEKIERSAKLTLRVELPGMLFPVVEESVIVRSFRRLDVKRKLESALPVALVSPFDHALEELYLERFREAVEGGYRSSVVDALHRIDHGIEDMEVLPGRRSAISAALYLRHAHSGRTPVSAFGDGVRRVLLLALTIPSLRGGCLLVDEIETAIHVSVLGDVFAWLVESCRKHDVQLFATTHSLEALDAILDASSGDLTEIAGYRFHDARRATPPQRYDGEQLHRLRYERGLEVR